MNQLLAVMLSLVWLRLDSTGRACFTAVPGGATEARLAVLFAGGAFGIWELDSRADLRQVLPALCSEPAVNVPTIGKAGGG